MPAAPEKTKDVVLDTGATSPRSTAAGGVPGGRIVPAPRDVPATATNNPAVANGNPANTSNDVVSVTTVARASIVVDGIGDVGLALLRAQSERGGKAGNAVVSPFSVASALGLVHTGAEGHTRDQISALFEPRAAQGRHFTEGMKYLTKALGKSRESGALLNANRIFVSKGLAESLSPAYTAAIRSNYAADGRLVDFSNTAEAAKGINDWVAEQTARKITNLVSPGAFSANTKAVLVNAVYFNGKWNKAFDVAATKPRPFHLDGGTTVEVPTMSGEITFREASVDGYTVYELPYRGGEYAMLIVMPPKGHTLQALEADTTGADLTAWRKKLTTVNAPMQLPKWNFLPSAASLKPALQSLGMVAAFEDSAKFTGITGKPNNGLYLSDVIHAAAITVDEAGTEAAAATAAVMGVKSLSLPPKPRMVDRPFLFAIVHQATSLPVFIGKVAKPE
jgi:serpin B